jgi:hypothetical protein
MDLISPALSALVFLTFVPGVLFTFPKHGSRTTVLAVHALLFVITLTLVMRYYWVTVKGYPEAFANYVGSSQTPCPNGYVPGMNQGGKPDCVPVGSKTYEPLLQ